MPILSRIPRICAIVAPLVFFAPAVLLAQEGGEDCAECEGTGVCFLGCEVDDMENCGPCGYDEDGCAYFADGCGGAAMIGLDGAVYVRSPLDTGTAPAFASAPKAPTTFEIPTPDGGSMLVRRCDNIVIARRYPAAKRAEIIAASRRFVL